MKRLVVAALLAVTHLAAADVTVPTGWSPSPDFAAALSPRSDYFGGTPATVTTEVYRAPIRGAVLYVTRAEAQIDAARRDEAASYELDELRRALERAGGDARAENQAQRTDATTKLLEGTIAWRDAKAGVLSSRRTVIAADAKRVVALAGECVLAMDLAPEITKACEAALASLVPDVPLAERIPLAIVANVAPAAPPEPAVGGSAAGTSSGPRLEDASKLPPIAPIIVTPPPAPRRDTDRRPVFLGLGLIVLALVFYWNKQRRDRFDRESDRDDDEDSADLHARAEPTKPPRKDDDDDAN